jgi:putative addiction module CopG family antidote
MSHVDLPDDVVRLAEAQVTAGRAGSIEDVVRAGVAVLERRQQRYDARLAALRAAIGDGRHEP